MAIVSSAKASAAEISELKKLIKATESLRPKETKPPEATTQPAKKERINFFSEDFKYVSPTREALKIDNPVKLLMMLKPELTPYRWQFEELMRSAGYLTTGDYETKSVIDDEHPYKLVLSAANGSGKDEIMIATFAVWFMLTGAKNRVIITTSSHKQMESQTEPAIKDLCKRANALFSPTGPQLIRSVQFHYVCPELGSEIRLFVTDEAERAEGFHPFTGGKMAIIANEAKSIPQKIFDALARCTGFSYWLEISSPGARRGHMYSAASSAISYPNPAILSKFYFRKVTAYECKHITKTHIETMLYEKGENDPWFQSSILANFSDYAEPVIIPEWIYDKCLTSVVMPKGEDIGIGVDFAGGGDENSCWVRRGNQIIFHYSFTQKDTTLAARLIDTQLSPWKDTQYTFNADNGGIGQAFIDQLRNLGWRVIRRNNQSPALKKAEFLNLGAEMWFHTKRLMERCDIILPKNIAKLREQTTTRYYKGMDSTQGKLALESKEEARANGHPSPDRADGLVLCFYSYRPSRLEIAAKEAKKGAHVPLPVSTQKLIEMFERGELVRKEQKMLPGRYSMIGKA